MRLSSRLKKYRLAALAFGLLSVLTLSPPAVAQDNRSGFDMPGRRGGGDAFLMQENPGPQGGGRPRGPMSERFRKYMQDDNGMPGDPGAGDFRGGGMRKRFQNLPPEQQQRLRERLQGMSREERRQFVQQMRRRGGQGAPMRPQGMQQGMRNGRPQMNPGGTRRNGRSMKGGRQWFGRKPIRLDKLNLTDDQKARIQKMRQVNSARARKVNLQLRSKRSRLKEMLFDPAATEKQILSQQASYNTLRKQADDIMLNDFLGIRSVLTKEQLNRLPEIKPGRRSRSNATRSVGAKRLSKKSISK